MSQNQGKASPKVARAGLAKFRSLTPNENKRETSLPTRSNLPNGWYFNEKREKSFWNEIEDSLTIERQEKIEQTNKQTDYQTQMEDSSTRLQSLISKFDDIDQNTLLAMMEIADDDDTNGESDPNQFLDDSKSQIVTFMSEMLDISEAQQTLVENLRSWFTNLLSNDSFLEQEKKEQPEQPNKQQVYTFLDSIVEICTEKTEKAQSLHNDVSDFWKKQVSTFKRILYRKDEEISKLKVTAEKFEALTSKKKGQKQLQKQKQKEEELNAKNQLIETQLATIEEQKSTIEKLRKDLQSSQASAAAAFLANSSSTDASKAVLEHDNSISNFQLEAQTQISLLNERITKLTSDNEKLNAQLNEERNQTKALTKDLEQKDLYIKDLESNNQKNLQLLALEREKTSPPIPPPDVPSENEDRLLEIVQMQENMKLLKQQHQQELIRQQELLREKFLVEKQKILDAMSTTENGKMVKDIIDDYENKLKLQKEDFDKLTLDITHSWGAKLDILTRQYENRIKALNASHGTEIIGIRNNAQYELKKKEIELEEDFNKRNLEISRERKDKDDQQKAKIDHLQLLLEYSRTENSKLRYIARSYSYKNPDIKRDFDAIPHHEEEEEEEKGEKENIVNNESKLIERQLVRIQILREITDEQTNWLLKQQKQSFEREIGQMTEKHQKDIRSLMLQIQDSLSKLTIEGENPITTDEALQLVSDMYIKMNEQVEETEELQPPTMTVEEANNRIKPLTDQLQQLKLQVSQKVNSDKPSDGNEFADISELENQILALKQRNEVLENLNSGDNKGAIESLLKMEVELRRELQSKDLLIEQLQKNLPITNQKKFFDFTESIIFHYGLRGQINNGYNGLPRKITLQRSMPDFLVLKDISSTQDPKPPLKSQIITNKLRKSKSQEFTGDFFKDEPFLKNQPEIVPVILQLKNGGITENRTNKLSISSIEGTLANSITKIPHKNRPQQPPSKSQHQQKQKEQQTPEQKKQEQQEDNNNDNEKAFSTPQKKKQESQKQTPSTPQPDLQVRTNINKENLGKETPKSKFSGRFLVETSVQNDLSKPSIFNNIDFTKLSVQSGVDAYTIPPTPKKPKVKPVRIIRRLDLVYGTIVELQPAPPPKPIIIEPDKKLLETIKELQERLLEIETRQREKEEKKKSEADQEHPTTVNREDMFTQMRIAIIDSSNKMIKRQKEIIAELQSRPPEVIYQTEIVRVPDVQLPPLEPINKVSFDYDLNYDSYYNKETKKETRKLKKSDHQKIQMSSITSLDVYKTLPPVNLEETFVDPEQERKNKLREMYPPPIYDRPPPTPVILDLASQVDDENVNDPFSTAIQALATIIRFVTNFNDNENHILSTLQNDTNAYEAFLTATCSDDESALQYLTQVKENESCFSKNIVQIEQLSILQMKLLNILKMSKKRAKGMAQEIQECRTAAAANELNSQQSILKEVQNDKNMDPKKSNIIILQKLESSLDVIVHLCLVLSSEEQARHAVLTKRVKDFQNQIDQQKQINQASIDSLIESVQNFISSIKPASAKTLKEIISSATKAEFDELNKKIKTLKESAKKYKKKLSQEQLNNEQLELQIKTLRSKLNEEKELSENAISVYQSQIAILKSLFNTLNIDASKDPLGMAEAVKNEVLSLQTLLGTSSSERDVLKAKVSDLEEILNQKDKHIEHLINQVDEITKKNIEYEETIVKYKEEMMFHSLDIEALRKEKEADIAMGTKHYLQLQEVIQKNQEVSEYSLEIENKMNEMKDKIRKLKEEKENLEIQIALSRFTSVKVPMNSVATQTILRLVGKKQEHDKNQNSYQRLKFYQQQQQQQQQKQQQEQENQNLQQNQNSSQNMNSAQNNDDDIPEHNRVVPESVPPLEGVPQSSLNQGKRDDGNDSHKNSPSSRLDGINHSNAGENNEDDNEKEEEEFEEVATDFAWELADSSDHQDSEGDTFAAEFPQAELEQITANHERFNPDEKAPEKVHKPLHFKKYKKILSKINKRPTTPKTSPSSAKSRPSTATKSNLQASPISGRPQTAVNRPKTPTVNQNNHQPINPTNSQEDISLAIGHPIPGHRALPGQLGKIKPTVTGRTALAMKAAFTQHPGYVIPVESARTYKFNNNSNNSNANSKPKKTFQNSPLGNVFPTAPNFITEYNNGEPSETIRITKIEYNHNNGEENNSNMNENEKENGPIILPIERLTVSCDPMSVNGPIAKTGRPFDLTEFERITAKLQARIQELLISLNKKDTIIAEMKKKYGELFGEKQHSEIKLVRLMDTVRRTEIRCENAQTRLEIVMKELNLRDDDNRELKKEMIRLKTLTGPASNTLAAVKESQMKQLQLKREKAKKKMVLIAAMSAIGSTNDKEVQKHLGKILENTQRSIARLEIKRRKFKEEERKQVYAALSAISLINDKKPETDTIHRMNFFNDENINVNIDNSSKWSQSRAVVMKNAWNSKANSVQHNNMQPIVFQNFENPDLNRKFPSYEHAMEMIDRIQPPLSVEEKRCIMRGDMTEEIAAKIAEFDKVEPIMPVLSGTKIDV